jgi:hypothetical protein
MTFGAYPQQHRISVSLQTPFLGAAREPSEALNDLEYEADSLFRLQYRQKAHLRRCLSFLTVLAFGTGIFIIVFQFVLLRKLWGQHPSHLEVLGEFNGLVPSCKDRKPEKSSIAADVLFTVRAEPKLFAPRLSFDPLNMSDLR